MNIIVEWVLPEVASNQRPLLYSRIETRTDASFPFKEVARAQAPAQSVTLADMAPGTYEVRVTAFDAAEVAGEPSDSAVITLAEAPGLIPPGKVTGVKLTQS